MIPPEDVDPACAGQWKLFDSPKRSDHERARALCDVCPTFALCELSLDHEDHRIIVGTWAGRLFNQPANRAAAQLVVK